MSAAGRIALALALSGAAAAEFVAQEKDFRCLLDGRAVAGKHRSKAVGATAAPAEPVAG